MENTIPVSLISSSLENGWLGYETLQTTTHAIIEPLNFPWFLVRGKYTEKVFFLSDCTVAISAVWEALNTCLPHPRAKTAISIWVNLSCNRSKNERFSLQNHVISVLIT